VNTYEVSNLQNYAAGIRARKAVTGVFDAVADRLKGSLECRQSCDRLNEWPRLELQRPGWQEIFGGQGNWKLSLHFCFPGVWGARNHAFWFEINLWHETHGNDWEQIRPKLPVWRHPDTQRLRSAAISKMGFSKGSAFW
jgi:hypothetical protein